MEKVRKYDQQWTIGGNITSEMCNEMSDELGSTIGYVK